MFGEARASPPGPFSFPGGQFLARDVDNAPEARDEVHALDGHAVETEIGEGRAALRWGRRRSFPAFPFVAIS